MTASALLLTVGSLLLAAAVFGLLVRGWRSRPRREADLPAPPRAPSRPGREVVAAAPGLFVGTTFADDWLDRVAVHALAHRATGYLTVASDGVHVEREGLTDLYLPFENISGAQPGNASAGKVIGKDGLLLVDWRLGRRLLTSGFRADDHALHRPLADVITAHLPAPEDAP